MNGEKRAMSFGFSIWEMRVYADEALEAKNCGNIKTGQVGINLSTGTGDWDSRTEARGFGEFVSTLKLNVLDALTEDVVNDMGMASVKDLGIYLDKRLAQFD